MTSIPEGARAAVCTKKGDPNETDFWIAEDANKVATRCIASRNNYLNCSSFTQPVDGKFSVRKDQFAALHFLIFDDVGTKVDRAKFEGVTPTWEIETSPGNSQVGILLREPITDIATADRLVSAIIARELNDAGTSGVSRWCRQPVAINGKRKHRGPGGEPFQCRLLVWNPTATYSVAEIVEILNLQLDRPRPSALVSQGPPTAPHLPRQEGDDIYTPAPAIL